MRIEGFDAISLSTASMKAMHSAAWLGRSSLIGAAPSKGEHDDFVSWIRPKPLLSDQRLRPGPMAEAWLSPTKAIYSRFPLGLHWGEGSGVVAPKGARHVPRPRAIVASVARTSSDSRHGTPPVYLTRPSGSSTAPSATA